MTKLNEYIAANKTYLDLLEKVKEKKIWHQKDIDLSIDCAEWALEEARMGVYDENDHEALKILIKDLEEMLCQN